MTTVIESGITIESGIIIGNVQIPIVYDIVTQDVEFLITQDGDNLVTENSQG